MFSEIPPLTNIETNKSIHSITKAYQLFHSTVTGEVYRSVGENRKEETHCIFHYTVKGQGEVVYKGVPHKTNPGEGFFNIINEAGSGYGYPKSAAEPWEFIVVCFDGGNTRQTVKELLENRVIYQLKNQNNFYLMCKKLLDTSSSDMMFTFFPRLISMIQDANKPLLQISTAFQDIVERDLLKNPTISAIASEMQISREHLQREYLKQTGITPAKHLNDKRFERLCYFLTTSSTEAEIAAAMNFPSVSGMALFFKRYTGTTPRQYRKNGYFTV